MSSKEHVTIGRVLVSPTKTAIVTMLTDRGAARFEMLKDKLGTSGGALNYHLKDLQAADIIIQGKDGSWALSPQGAKISEKVRQIVGSVMRKD